MRFDILELILWPKGAGFSRKRLHFKPGCVNIITGISGSGKSALIPILDYCLASSGCRIPVGPIRKKCAWYGVLLQTNNRQLLLSREDPGENKGGTARMCLLQGEQINIPQSTPQQNASRDDVASFLDNLVGLGDVPGDPDEPAANRSSFRDLIGFCFQPQYMIANPRVLYYRTDTQAHTERLIRAFPFALGAENVRVLYARWRLKEVEKDLRAHTRESERNQRNVEEYGRDVDRWLAEAKARGLLDPGLPLPSQVPEKIDRLRRVVDDATAGLDLSASWTEALIKRKKELEREETNKALELREASQRLNQLEALREASFRYGEALEVQRSRLGLANYLRQRKDKPSSSCPVCGGTFHDSHAALDQLCATLDSLEEESRRLPATPPPAYLKHYNDTKKMVDELNELLKGIRQELAILDEKFSKEEGNLLTAANLNRFFGRLEQALASYDGALKKDGLGKEIGRLKDEQSRLNSTIGGAKQRRDNALEQVARLTEELVSNLSVEYRQATVKVVVNDLMLNILHDGREDPLWAIGSGANWVGYHVALLLGLHRYFSRMNTPVPGFVVFDQPSQLNYPRSLTDNNKAEELIMKRSEFSGDVSIDALRKIYAAFAHVVSESSSDKYLPQVIVLDHAMQSVWGHISNHVHHVADWGPEREKLVPDQWPSFD